MAARPRWLRLVLIASAVEAALLAAQYLLGLWTNLYGPSTFTSGSSLPSLDWHYNIGYAVGLVALLMVIFAALARDRRVLPPAVVLLLAVIGAAIFGGEFVSSSPNNPADSFAMGALFLVALATNMTIVFRLRFSREMPAPKEYTPSAPTQTT